MNCIHPYSMLTPSRSKSVPIWHSPRPTATQMSLQLPKRPGDPLVCSGHGLASNAQKGW